MNSSHAASLYDKLNNVHASLRKQKEDAFRTKQLAEERLRLARQDREAMEKKGVETRVQLRQMMEKATEMKSANSKMEAENKQLEKEYNFQHAELQSKKEKLTRLEDKRKREANNRHYSLTDAREMLRRLREDSSKNDSAAAAHYPPEEKRRRLELMLEVDGGVELCKNLPQLVKVRRSRESEEVKKMETRIASMRRIIAGYQNALGVGGSMEIHNQGANSEIVQQ